jgi:uncharacterized protein YjcR
MKHKRGLALPAPASDPGAPRVSNRQDRAIGMLVEGHGEEFIAYKLGIEPSLLRSWKKRPRFRRAWAARGGDVSWRDTLAQAAREWRALKEEKSE